MILHAVPYSAFDFSTSFSSAILRRHWSSFAPLGRSSPTHPQINFDGLACLSNADVSAPEQHSYVQVFRSGAVEGVATIQKLNNGNIRAADVDKYAVASTLGYAQALGKLGVNAPFAILVTLTATGRKSLLSGLSGSEMTQEVPIIKAPKLYFSEIVIDGIPANLQECATALRPLLEQVWNAAGFATAQSFDANGNWILPD